MFGFIIGTLSLIGLIKVARWGRRGRGWMLRRLFERLDTTPGQEKVILEAVDDVQRKAYAVRDGLYGTRGAVAAAMRGERFDGEAVDAAFDAEQARLDEVKKAVRENLAKVHEALNPDQRKALGDLFEFGPGRLHGCGGHFHHHHRRAHGPADTVSL